MNLKGIIGHSRELKKLSSLNGIERMPHSILFTGTKGIGKRMIAERFFGSFLCRETNPPCGVCRICRQVAAGTYPDFLILEKDEKGRIPIGSREKFLPGSVRWLIDKLVKTASTGYYSVIIDGVDTISESGQNALLKTIEEPNAKAYIILIAESRSGILPTIISRCIEIPFFPLKEKDILKILKLRGIDTDKSELLAKISGGSADTAVLLHDDNLFSELMNVCGSISGFVKQGRNGMFKYNESKVFHDDEFLLTVLINIYSYMVRTDITGDLSESFKDISVNYEDALKIVRILLAMKKGLGSNLNVKNILKGFMYSFDEISSSGVWDPDFSWLI